MAWMPGDDEAAGAVAGMVETYGRKEGAMDRLLSNREAAEYLGFQPQTLARWRWEDRKDRPREIKVGRSVRYYESELLRWVSKHGRTHTASLNAAMAQTTSEQPSAPAETGLTITPEVCRRDGMDRVHLSRRSGDRIRVVVLQRVGDDGTEASARTWAVLDAFAVCIWGERDPLTAVLPQRSGPLDELAGMAERWCRLGVWQ